MLSIKFMRAYDIWQSLSLSLTDTHTHTYFTSDSHMTAQEYYIISLTTALCGLFFIVFSWSAFSKS